MESSLSKIPDFFQSFKGQTPYVKIRFIFIGLILELNFTIENNGQKNIINS